MTDQKPSPVATVADPCGCVQVSWRGRHVGTDWCSEHRPLVDLEALDRLIERLQTDRQHERHWHRWTAWYRTSVPDHQVRRCGDCNEVEFWPDAKDRQP